MMEREVSLNGQRITTRAPTLQALLQAQGYNLAAAMACAVNREFVARPRWSEHALQAGDLIDVITPITGG